MPVMIFLALTILLLVFFSLAWGHHLTCYKIGINNYVVQFFLTFVFGAVIFVAASMLILFIVWPPYL